MNLTDHDNVKHGSMYDPPKEHQAAYYKLYREIEDEFSVNEVSTYEAKSRRIHAEVTRRMGLK